MVMTVHYNQKSSLKYLMYVLKQYGSCDTKVVDTISINS